MQLRSDSKSKTFLEVVMENNCVKTLNQCPRGKYHFPLGNLGLFDKINVQNVLFIAGAMY